MKERRSSWEELQFQFAGVPQTTLARLARKASSAMQETTLEALKRYAAQRKRSDWWDELDTALLGPDERALRQAFQWSTSTEVLRFFEHRGYHFVAERGRVRSVEEFEIEPWTDDDAELVPFRLPVVPLFGHALARLREFGALYRHLLDIGCGDLFEDLTKVLRKVGLDAESGPSLIRMLGPLLESSASGFVARDWREMAPKELRRFVSSGVSRERILMNRGTDVQRVQEISRRGPRFLSGPSAPKSRPKRKASQA
jgi:hypothetical protein